MGILYAIGEALIDFTAQERGSLEQANTFCKNAGGAPANVATCVAKLGGNACIITKLGQDAFGRFLTRTLEEAGVDTRYIFTTAQANTALAFVSRDQSGERDFSFYRNPSADMLLSADDIKTIDFQKGDILHFGSVDLCAAPVKGAHDAAIAAARAAGALVSFDPNLRYSLWHSREALLSTVRSYLPLADIVKVSEEELVDITGISEEGRAVKTLFCGEVKLVIVTKGKEGATAYTECMNASAPADLTKKPVDTTGAGDSFIGTVLYQILLNGLNLNDRAAMEKMLFYANRAAGCVVSREGAIPAMPARNEVF